MWLYFYIHLCFILFISQKFYATVYIVNQNDSIYSTTKSLLNFFYFKII